MKKHILIIAVLCITFGIMLITSAIATAQSANEFVVPLTDPAKRGKLKAHLNYGSITIKGTARKDVLVKYKALEDDEDHDDDDHDNGNDNDNHDRPKHHSPSKEGMKKIGGATTRPGSAWSSTSSGSSASSSSVFGIRIPRELPILTMRVRVVIVITV